jgi:hypothetical protein
MAVDCSDENASVLAHRRKVRNTHQARDVGFASVTVCKHCLEHFIKLPLAICTVAFQKVVLLEALDSITNAPRRIDDNAVGGSFSDAYFLQDASLFILDSLALQLSYFIFQASLVPTYLRRTGKKGFTPLETMLVHFSVRT